MRVDYGSLGVYEALDSLSSSPDGLTGEEAKERLAASGPNEITTVKKRSPPMLFLSQFKDLMVIVLIAAALISVGLAAIEGSSEGWLDAIIIMIIVILNAVLGFVQEYKAERTIEALRDLSAPKANVIRDGKEITIPSKELVQGDIILLTTGDKVSADARLLEIFNLRINEASLTGESVSATKSVEPVEPGALLGDRTSMVFSGSIVDYGRGKAVVTATADSTELGHMAGLLQDASDVTPLQKKLTVLGKQLGLVVLLTTIVLFVISLMRQLELQEVFLTSVSLAVAAIPEGLPAIVTVSLALGLQRMAKRNAIMRRLPAVESLGSATVICTDKTGTLTKGEMNIREIATHRVFEVLGDGYVPEGRFQLEGRKVDPRDEADLQRLLLAGALCNDAFLFKEGNRWKVKGDPTEGTLLVTAKKAGIDLDALRGDIKRIFEVPFDSSTKRMITVHEKGGRKAAYLKGAAESVLKLCSEQMMDEMAREVTDKDRENWLRRNDEMAGRALRVLAIAYKDLKEGDVEGQLDHGFVFLGLVGMIDSPRTEAIDAIKRCKAAGVRVIMITGDHELTAKAIASEMCISKCGIANVMNGRDLESISIEELQERVKTIDAFARVAPEHKVKIVEALRRNGEIVAMTGDGVNDAPALKAADIGIAMGITGTDVAKESAEMVLADDNFATIANAIEEGRGIYDNIQRFVSFLLTCNSGEVMAMFAASVLFADPTWLPFLLPVQLLWMNLITDGLPALALGMEQSGPELMYRPPREPTASPVNRKAIVKIVMIGAVLAFIAILAFVLVHDYSSNDGDCVGKARTAALCAIVLSQMMFVFSSRSEKQSLAKMDPLSNRKLVLAVGVSLLLQFAIVYVSPLSEAFRTVPLGWEEWAIIGPISLLALISNELWKYLERKHDEKSGK